jgi:hypothetical protein
MGVRESGYTLRQVVQKLLSVAAEQDAVGAQAALHLLLPCDARVLSVLSCAFVEVWLEASAVGTDGHVSAMRNMLALVAGLLLPGAATGSESHM